MPWQAALQKVDEDEADGLEVVPSALLDSQVSVDRGVPGRACQALVVLVRDVLSGFGVSVALGEPKIDDIYYVLFLAMSYEEVVWLHVSMNEVIVVKELEPLDHLISYHQGRFYREFALAIVE